MESKILLFIKNKLKNLETEHKETKSKDAYDTNDIDTPTNKENIDKELSVYLNIYFNKKINLSNIINNLIKQNINLSLNEEDKFNKLTFIEYKNCELFNKTKLNNFYDIIIYVLLNIQK
jgi:hypothetical protein